MEKEPVASCVANVCSAAFCTGGSAQGKAKTGRILRDRDPDLEKDSVHNLEVAELLQMKKPT